MGCFFIYTLLRYVIINKYLLFINKYLLFLDYHSKIISYVKCK